VRSKEYFAALHEKAQAERKAAENSTAELNRFVNKRLKNLQKVGRSVLAKSFGRPARYRAPEGTPNEYKWVSQMVFVVKAIRDEKNGTVIVISDNVFVGQKETLTKVPLETIYLSDRAFATQIRKAIKAEKKERQRKMLADLEKQLSKIRKNPNLSTGEKAAIMSAKGLLGVFASAS
jgi:hypothetical protein